MSEQQTFSMVDVKDYHIHKVKVKIGIVCLIVVALICAAQFRVLVLSGLLGYSFSTLLVNCFENAVAMAILGCLLTMLVQQIAFFDSVNGWENKTDEQKQAVYNEYAQRVQEKTAKCQGAPKSNVFEKLRGKKKLVIAIVIVAVILGVIFNRFVGTLFGVLFVAILVKKILEGSAVAVSTESTESVASADTGVKKKQSKGRREWVPGTGCKVDPDTGVYYDFWFGYPVPPPVKIQDDDKKKK